SFPMTRKARIVAALLTATLILASNPNLLAQDASHKLSAMDEFQIQLPTDPQISPDGKRIVYVRRFADPMTDKRYSNLWIINTDGTDDPEIRVALVGHGIGDRKSTRLNSSHVEISYAVFCLKKKKKIHKENI